MSCNNVAEDLAHVFFHCSFAGQVWRLACLWHEVSRTIQTTIFSLTQKLQGDLQQRFANIHWSLWKHRNLKFWQNENELCVHVVDRARHLMKDWVATHAPSRNPPIRRHSSVSSQFGFQITTHTIKWQKPQPGRFKCNIDNAFSSL